MQSMFMLGNDGSCCCRTQQTLSGHLVSTRAQGRVLSMLYTPLLYSQHPCEVDSLLSQFSEEETKTRADKIIHSESPTTEKLLSKTRPTVVTSLRPVPWSLPCPACAEAEICSLCLPG